MHLRKRGKESNNSSEVWSLWWLHPNTDANLRLAQESSQFYSSTKTSTILYIIVYRKVRNSIVTTQMAITSQHWHQSLHQAQKVHRTSSIQHPADVATNVSQASLPSTWLFDQAVPASKRYESPRSDDDELTLSLVTQSRMHADLR